MGGPAFALDVAVRDTVLQSYGMVGREGLASTSRTFPLRSGPPILERDDMTYPASDFTPARGSQPRSFLDQLAGRTRALVNTVVGAEEIVIGGAYNYVVRAAAGAASLPYLLDSTRAAAEVQEGLSERYGYEMRTEGARDITNALAPVGRVIGGAIQSGRDFSVSTMGDPATTIIGSGVQAGAEILGVWSGGRGRTRTRFRR